MDFRLDDDQAALSETVEQFCAGRWPIDGLAERAPGIDRAGWDELVGLGVTSLMAPVDGDGMGFGAVEGAVVFEQLGRHLVPGPLLWSALAATLAADVARGERIATGVVDGGGDGPYFVEHATFADEILVLRDDSVAVVDAGDVDATDADEPLDPLNPIAVVAALPRGRTVGDGEVSTRLHRLGTVLTAAQQVGVAQSALDVSVSYSLEREQFGVPIGSFQALKHMMADMYVRIGLARSATYAAAAVLDDPDVAPLDATVRTAKLLAGEAALENARTSVQILGGMGFTWEMPPNFLLKRAWVLERSFGTGAEHALALADHVEAGVPA